MSSLADLGEVVHETREALGRYLYLKQSPLDTRPGALTDTLNHLGEVREGFQLSLRVGSVTQASELHALVRRFLVDWRWLEEEGFTLMSSDDVHRVRTQLLAFAHAYTALAFLPRLPAPHITYPGRATYADIPVPRTPGETLERIDELEDVLTRASVRPRQALHPEPLRRTYGYFEVSAWLIQDYRQKARP
jgi:hypothetical protein